INIGPGDAVQATVRNTIGNRTRSHSWSSTVAQVKETRSRGGGHTVWAFMNGSLTFLRTFESGGRMINIKFSGGSAGLTCTINAPFAREVGAGPIRQVSP